MAYLMFPFRLVFFLVMFTIVYTLVLVISILRAIYLRLAKGAPSQILKQGTYPVRNYKPDMNYVSYIFFDKPLEEDRLRKALVSLCAEDDVPEDKIEVKMFDEVPTDWAAGAGNVGSVRSDYYLPKTLGEEGNMVHHGMSNMGSGYWIRMHVFNGAPGKPTIMIYFGSVDAWDGSSNFNFAKELINRYCGNKPNNVFQRPEIDPKFAKILDQGSFLWFMLKMPFNIAWNVKGWLWSMFRSFKCFGGNGFGFRMCFMNFSPEESKKLAAGAKAMGVKPFGVFCYAGVKASEEVMKERALCITQQASMQSRYYRAPGQDKDRDFVGDWLIGPVQFVGKEYTLQDAQKGYDQLMTDMDEAGPSVRKTFWAKAYGVINSGAAGFEAFPFYNDNMHVMDRCIFMNNYGVRTVDPSSGWKAWNWNAPMWLGINTICVNGVTTTMVGSAFMGMEMVEDVRDHIEATCREIMSNAKGISEITRSRDHF